MEDDDFDDLLAGADMLPGSSQESLTFAAAKLDFFDDSDHDVPKCPASPPSSVFDMTSPDPGRTPDQFIEAQAVQAAALPDEGAVCINKAEQPQHSNVMTNGSVLKKIENVFKSVKDDLFNNKDDLSITLKLRTSRAKSDLMLQKAPTQKAPTARSKRLCFPGKTEEEAWRFTVVIRILELMHEALLSGVVLSQRDIFYRDPALFGRQSVVNRYIDDIAFTFGVKRSDLNVTAVAKGLIVGAVKFCRRNGSAADAASDREGMLVPSLFDILSVDMRAVRWILVVEKEASFRSIAASEFWNDTSTEGVMLTGKGYPDIATRALLHFLSTPSPRNGFASPSVFGLVDFDPDGLAILSVYKHGSAALSHENEDLCAPQMQWLGLTAEDIKSCGNDVHVSQGLLTLTERDRKKATLMLEKCRAEVENASVALEEHQALQTMLMLNMKAEVQLLEARPSGTVDMLRRKLGGL